MDVLRHWGLGERPFETTLEARFFYASESHQEALARLELMAEDGDMGFGLLTGEPGSGKTFAAAVFAGLLDRRRFAPVFLTSAPFGASCVLDELNCALRGSEPTGRPPGRYELLVEFRRLLGARIAMQGLQLVLILDEAQDLSDGGLADLRGLLNTAVLGAGRGLLTIVLVASPELGQRLRRLRAVDTRVGLRYRLRRMRSDEVEPYVLHRLREAGPGAGRVFSEEAAAALAASSRGVPREVNRIARLALYVGAAAGARMIEPDHILTVVNDSAPLAWEGAA